MLFPVKPYWNSSKGMGASRLWSLSSVMPAHPLGISGFFPPKGKWLKNWVMKIHLLEQSWECQPGVAGVVGLCSDDLRNLERGFLEKKVPCSCAVL